MESVFCFQIAIETLHLRKKVTCEIPFVSVVFLNFPTIFIQLDKAKHEKKNRYLFQKGKSCLFKMSPTELYKSLSATPIYILVLDQRESSKTDSAGIKHPVSVGSTSLSLNDAMKMILRGIQNCGLCRASSHGESLTLPVISALEDVIGHINLAYKLTCLGHTMLPHLQNCPVADLSVKPKNDMFKYIVPKEHLSSIENVDNPPVLYYKAEAGRKKTEPDKKQQNVTEGDENKVELAAELENQVHHDQATTAVSLEEKRKSVLLEWQSRTQAFIRVTPHSGQKTESTQTDMQHLNQFPILKALIEEVVELGINKSTSVSIPETLAKAQLGQKQPEKLVKSAPRKSPLRKQEPQPSPSEKKRRSLSFGLTKTHMLRLSINKQPDFSKTYTKPLYRQETQHKRHHTKRSFSKRRPMRRLVSSFTQTRKSDLRHAEVSSDTEGISTVSESIELNFESGRDTEDASPSPGKSSPRVLSRQSIEIRLPSAITESLPESEEHLSDKDEQSDYKYSDDFEDDQSMWRSRTVSSLTAIDTSPSHTAYDLRDEAANRTEEDVSPGPADSYQGHSLMKASHESIPEEPEYQSANELLNETVADASSSSSVSQSTARGVKSNSALKVTSGTEDDSKPTDNSAASVVTTLYNSELPKPAPSSDSPVIRSLVSESGGRKKPRPPKVSQSSSVERLQRKFKRSSELSMQFSDLSDLRSSELADIRTSDFSDLKSTDDNISPIHSTDMLGGSSSLPQLKEKRAKRM